MTRRKHCSDTNFLVASDLCDNYAALAEETGLTENSAYQRMLRYKKMGVAVKEYVTKPRGRVAYGPERVTDLQNILERIRAGENVEV